MNKTAKITLLIIGVIAIVVAFGMHSFLTAARTTIFLFAGNYPAGTEITQDILIADEIETRIITQQLEMRGEGDPRFITEYNLDRVLGSYLRTDAVIGTLLLSSHASDVTGSPVEIGLTPNNVAIAIPVDNIEITNPSMIKGARVNIYAGFEAGDSRVFTVPFAQYVRVLDVLYAQLLDENIGTPVVSGVVVELAPQQSLELAHYIENGTVRLGVVRPGGYTIIPLTAVESVIPQEETEENTHE